MRSSSGTVAEVVALINHDKIVISPVDTVDWKSYYSASTITRQIGMIQNIIAQTIRCQWIVNQVTTICHPVLG